MKAISWIVLIATATALSACGGGGGSASSSPASNTPPPVVQPADFTTFVKEQLTVQDFAAPADVEATKFSFSDDDNPAAFNDMFAKAE